MASEKLYRNTADTGDLFKIPDVEQPFWKGYIEAGLQNNF